MRNGDQIRAMVTVHMDPAGSWSVVESHGLTIPPEHNYHDLGAGMLIDELLGTIDQAIGEYEG
jgi:hypothetical protein